MSDTIGETSPPQWFGSLGETLARQREANQAAVGRAFEKARRRVGLPTERAAEKLGITARQLAYLEAGIRTPSPTVIKDMAELYGTKVEAFGARSHASRIPPHIDFETQTLWIGWTPIPLGGEATDNRHVIRSLASALRDMRSLSAHQPVYLREREVPMIGSLLDLTDPELPATMMEGFGLSLREVTELLDVMRRS